MTADFDTLVRDTLHGLADRAPGEAAVRAALARKRRSRLPLVAAVASVLLVATAVPVLRVGGAPGGVPPTPDFQPAVTAETPFSLHPTWLPPGLTEQARGVSHNGDSKVRVWHTAPLNRLPLKASLVLAEISTALIERKTLPVVDIGEMGSAYSYSDVGGSGLLWEWEGKTMELVAPQAEFDRDTLIRVARGLRPGEASVARTALEFGFLPDQATVLQSGVRAAQNGGGTFFQHAVGLHGEVTVELTPDPPVLPDPVVVGDVLGRPARFATKRAAAVQDWTERLVVDLGGRWLVVSHAARSLVPDPGYADVLRRTAEDVRIGAEPANPWLGTR